VYLQIEWMFKKPATVELTHNHGAESDDAVTFHSGNSDPRGFGHIGFEGDIADSPPSQSSACIFGYIIWYYTFSIIHGLELEEFIFNANWLYQILCCWRRICICSNCIELCDTEETLLTIRKCVCTAVPDVYAACKRFEDLGVEFQKKPDAGNMKGIAFIKDPDGYWIEILNAKASRAFRK